MQHTTKTFELGNTIYFECVYRNTYGVLVDPDSPNWSIKNSKGVTQASGDTEGGPYKRSTGLWYIFWTSSDIGDYILEFTGSIGGHDTKIRRPFRVKKTAAIN